MMMTDDQFMGLCADCGKATWVMDTERGDLCVDCEAEYVLMRERNRLDDYDDGIIWEDDF